MKIDMISAACGDWDVLYVDGVLKAQGYSIMIHEVAKACGIEFQYREVKDSFAERGFPDKIEDIHQRNFVK